ncbi:MAG: T9SS type A sorting domain-containing protein [Ignavibacteriaceae bacterium]|nr:T9SS type A sorting domain-containing protein [Ignavibacteriaceae bacterium]
MSYTIAIPVELTSFTSEFLQDEIAVKLCWTTATEANNSGFTIERMSIPNSKSEFRNSNWTEIGFVPGFGTSTETKTYSFIDENLISETYKYRLKTIDFDGSFEYSNEIEVEVDFTPIEFVLYQNYPNPFNPSTKIKFTIPDVETHRDASLQMVTLKVYDVLGNEITTLVNEEKQTGVYEVEFDAQTLSSGIYIYKLQAGTFIQTKKMVLMR